MARREWQNPSVLERDGASGREYYIRYREKRLDIEDGKPVIRRVEKWRHLGYCAKMTKRQAEREKDRILREINQQVYTVQSQVPWPAFVAVFDQNHIAALAVPTQNNYRQQLRLHITPAFQGLRLSQIGPLEIQQLFTALEASGLSHATRDTIRGVMAAAFRCAKKWRFIEGESPMEGVDIGGGPRRVRECRIPSVEDVERLMGLCAGDVPLLIETLVTTGMRISEASGLLAADLDFTRAVFCVTRRRCRGDVGQTKTEAGVRLLPMGGVLEAMRAHVADKAPTDSVFTYNGLPIVDCALLDNYVTPRMRKLGIKFPGFGWHTFRRLHLSLMSQRMSLFDLRRQAGHTSVRTTQLYVADDVGRRAEAVAKPFLLKKKPA